MGSYMWRCRHPRAGLLQDTSPASCMKPAAWMANGRIQAVLGLQHDVADALGLLNEASSGLRALQRTQRTKSEIRFGVVAPHPPDRFESGGRAGQGTTNEISSMRHIIR